MSVFASLAVDAGSTNGSVKSSAPRDWLGAPPPALLALVLNSALKEGSNNRLYSHKRVVKMLLFQRPNRV